MKVTTKPPQPRNPDIEITMTWEECSDLLRAMEAQLPVYAAVNTLIDLIRRAREI